MEHSIFRISEAENEDADIGGGELETPENPDYNILKRNLEIYGANVEKYQKNESVLQEKIEKYQSEVSQLRTKLLESNINYDEKIQKLKSENELLKKEASKDLVNQLKSTIVQKDRRIRNLNTSVTLLK